MEKTKLKWQERREQEQKRKFVIVRFNYFLYRDPRGEERRCKPAGEGRTLQVEKGNRT